MNAQITQAKQWMGRWLWVSALVLAALLHQPVFPTLILAAQRTDRVAGTCEEHVVATWGSVGQPEPFSPRAARVSSTANTWARTYGGSRGDSATAIQPTADGGYIVAGATRSFGDVQGDLWVLKLDGQGTVQWEKTYGGPVWEWANVIRATSDGGYIVAGYTSSFGAGAMDVWVLKLDGQGNIQWQKTYGGSQDEEAFDIQTTSDGGYIVVGYTASFGDPDNDLWVLKLDGAGNVQWQKTYGGGREESGSAVQITGDGGYIVAGSTKSFVDYDGDAWILKLNSAGDIEWQKVYGGSLTDSVSAIWPTGDGGYIVAGGAESGAHYNSVWVANLDSQGNLIWQKIYDGNSVDFAVDLWPTADGGYIVAGNTKSFSDFDGDVWVLKLDASGDIQWQKTYGGPDWDVAEAIWPTADGGYVVAGLTASFGAGGVDAWVLNLDGQGDVSDCVSPIVGMPSVVPSQAGLGVYTSNATPAVSSATVSVSSATPVASSATVGDQCPPSGPAHRLYLPVVVRAQ